jgi:hypothetical protein
MRANKTQEIPCIPAKSYARMCTLWSFLHTDKSSKSGKRVPDASKWGPVTYGEKILNLCPPGLLEVGVGLTTQRTTMICCEIRKKSSLTAGMASNSEGAQGPRRAVQLEFVTYF